MAVRDIRSLAELADAELAHRASSGDSDAFEELYRRHSGAAWGVAQAAAANGHDAADAVSEAFTRMLTALAGGRLAPDVPFRPYLLVTTRNVAMDQHRRAARNDALPTSLILTLPAASAGPGEKALDSADAGFVSEAFRSLPERYRTVLWLTEVEGMTASEVGARLGLTANNAAQLAHRARTSLRERFLQAHLQHRPAPDCEATVAQLGAYVAGRLTPKNVAAIDQHLAGCEDCRTRVAQLADVDGSLRAIALPIPAGLGAAALARYHVTFPAATSMPTPGMVRRMIAGPEHALRSLSVATGALLTAGVITAGLMGSGGGPSPVRGSRTGGIALNSPPSVHALPAAPAVDVSPIPPDLGSSALSTRSGAPPFASITPSAALAPSGQTAQGPTVGATHASPPPPPPSSQAAGPSNPPALVQVATGANLGVLSVSGSLGVAGGCTGVSVNRSPSCAPPAPSKPGVTVAAVTPVGKVGNAVPATAPKL